MNDIKCYNPYEKLRRLQIQYINLGGTLENNEKETEKDRTPRGRLNEIRREAENGPKTSVIKMHDELLSEERKQVLQRIKKINAEIDELIRINARPVMVAIRKSGVKARLPILFRLMNTNEEQIKYIKGKISRTHTEAVVAKKIIWICDKQRVKKQTKVNKLKRA